MATVVCSAGALDNLEGAIRKARSRDPVGATNTVAVIASAFDALASHPLLGRRVHAELRELAISCGGTGYVALYRFLIASDEVRVLALRSQREIGYVP